MSVNGLKLKNREQSLFLFVISSRGFLFSLISLKVVTFSDEDKVEGSNAAVNVNLVKGKPLANVFSLLNFSTPANGVIDRSFVLFVSAETSLYNLVTSLNIYVVTLSVILLFHDQYMF